MLENKIFGPDLLLHSYDFKLPKELIAQEPPLERGKSNF